MATPLNYSALERNRITVLFAPLLALWFVGCGAAALPQVDQLGQVPSSARTLPDLRTDGPVDLSATVASHSATVVMFWSPSCPCVGRYQARMHKLRLDYQSRGVAFLAVASNAGESAPFLRKGARKLDWQLVWDRYGHLAQSFGARSTPTIVILKRSGEIAFRGWLDNEHKPGHPSRKTWARHALNDVLAGKLQSLRQTRVYGCAITRDPNAPKPACAAPKRVRVETEHRCGHHAKPSS